MVNFVKSVKARVLEASLIKRWASLFFGAFVGFFGSGMVESDSGVGNHDELTAEALGSQGNFPKSDSAVEEIIACELCGLIFSEGVAGVEAVSEVEVHHVNSVSKSNLVFKNSMELDDGFGLKVGMTDEEVVKVNGVMKEALDRMRELQASHLTQIDEFGFSFRLNEFSQEGEIIRDGLVSELKGVLDDDVYRDFMRHGSEKIVSVFDGFGKRAFNLSFGEDGGEISLYVSDGFGYGRSYLGDAVPERYRHLFELID